MTNHDSDSTTTSNRRRTRGRSSEVAGLERSVDRQLPEQFAERFAVVLGREDPPDTLADWASAISTFFADRGVSIDVEELCHTDASRHGATVAGEQRYFQCVLDPLLVPFLDGTGDRVAVTSRSPVEDVPVEIEVRRSRAAVDGATDTDDAATEVDDATTEVAVEPADAVVSLGVAADGPPATELEAPLEAYGLFCPYVNAFPDREAYEAWDGETPEAVSTAISVEEAVGVARELADAPGRPGRSH